MNRDTQPKQVAGRRESKKAETAQRIAIAGRKLLRTKGFEAVTTHEVALEAGIPPGTLFGYISSKTDLLILALIHEAIEFVGTVGPRVPQDASFLDRVCFVYEEMATYHGRDVEMSRHFLREVIIPRNPDLREKASGLGNAVRELVARIVAEQQAAGGITTALPAAKISMFLFAHYWRALRQWLSGNGTREGFSVMLTESLHWQLAGLAPRADDPAGTPGPWAGTGE